MFVQKAIRSYAVLFSPLMHHHLMYDGPLRMSWETFWRREPFIHSINLSALEFSPIILDRQGFFMHFLDYTVSNRLSQFRGITTCIDLSLKRKTIAETLEPFILLSSLSILISLMIVIARAGPFYCAFRVHTLWDRSHSNFGLHTYESTRRFHFHMRFNRRPKYRNFWKTRVPVVRFEPPTSRLKREVEVQAFTNWAIETFLPHFCQAPNSDKYYFCGAEA